MPGEEADAQDSELCKLRGAFSPQSFPGFSIYPSPFLLLLSSLPFLAPYPSDGLAAQVLLLTLPGINGNEVWGVALQPSASVEAAAVVSWEEAVWFWTH